MKQMMTNFWTKEDGAIAVDWFVISAALVGLAAATIIAIQGATVDLAITTSDGVANQNVGGTNTAVQNGSGS